MRYIQEEGISPSSKLNMVEMTYLKVSVVLWSGGLRTTLCDI